VRGEGLRRLLAAADRIGLRAEVIAALGRARKITRGPKPARALKEIGLSSDLPAAVPTSAGVIDGLRALDLRGRRVGVQLYGEEPNRPTRAIVHRYGDRALFLAVDRCSVYCRHCTRRRITFAEGEGFDRAAVEEGIAYVRAHREVRDVVVSGGDPLVLSDERLVAILAGLRAIPHVQILRVATRAPVTCPMRVTPDLAALLRRFAPLFVVTHFNHPKELTPDARAACEASSRAGIRMSSE